MARLKSGTVPFSTTYVKAWTKLRANERKKRPEVLLAYKTTKRVPIGETLFSFAYGTEAIIPVDISMPTFRIEGVVLDHNDTLLRLMLAHSEEKA